MKMDMIKLTLILIAILALTLSSCKEEEKEHFMFLKFLLEAENPEEFLKSSSYYDSIHAEHYIDFKTISWFSQIVKEEGFDLLRIKSYGIATHHNENNVTTVHNLRLRHRYSYHRVLIGFDKNEEGVWKLSSFSREHS
jgi:hypothetical protein